jgi:hypothetical protein
VPDPHYGKLIKDRHPHGKIPELNTHTNFILTKYTNVRKNPL